MMLSNFFMCLPYIFSGNVFIQIFYPFLGVCFLTAESESLDMYMGLENIFYQSVACHFIVFNSILCRTIYPFGWNSIYQVFPSMNFYFTSANRAKELQICAWFRLYVFPLPCLEAPLYVISQSSLSVALLWCATNFKLLNYFNCLKFAHIKALSWKLLHSNLPCAELSSHFSYWRWRWSLHFKCKGNLQTG